MIIRPATVDDRDAVTTLALRFHASSPYARLLKVDAVLVGVLFDLALEQGTVIVGELESYDGAALRALVGFIALVALEHTVSGDRYAEEVAWWVEPAHRVGLLGPRLLRRAEGWAVTHGCAFLKMAAPAGTDVGAFYERQGYAAIETAYMKRLAALPEVA